MNTQLVVGFDPEPTHPEGWRCPWCDRHPVTGEVDTENGCQAMDRSLPRGLRLCWWCEHPGYSHPRPISPTEAALWEQIGSLRATLRKFLADDWSPRRGARGGARGGWGLSVGGSNRWTWRNNSMEAFAGIFGRSLLGALEGLGLNPQDELEAALADHPEAQRSV
jgi:hypothetical protein